MDVVREAGALKAVDAVRGGAGAASELGREDEADEAAAGALPKMADGGAAAEAVEEADFVAAAGAGAGVALIEKGDGGSRLDVGTTGT